MKIRDLCQLHAVYCICYQFLRGKDPYVRMMTEYGKSIL